MTRDDIIRMAQDAGIEFSLSPMAMVTQSELQRFAELVAAKETEARKAAQLETIALREELTKRAMQADREAYQSGVRDEREACAKMCDDMEAAANAPKWAIWTSVGSVSAAIRARNNKDNQQ